MAERYVLDPEEPDQQSQRFVLDAQEKQAMPWKDVGMSAIKNLPGSAKAYAKDFISAVSSPIDTIKGLTALGQGGVVNLMPDAAMSAINRIDPSRAKRREEVSGMASQVGQQYATDYGSMEGFKNKVATDPVGTLGDISGVLSLGGGAASKIPMLNRAATVPTKVLGKAVPKAIAGKQIPSASNVLKKAGDVTNPVNLAAKPVVAAGNIGANVISGFGTHTGAMPIKEAFKSGVEGGQRGQAFRENMRGKVPVEQVLDDAKFNLNQMKDAKTAQYNANRAKWETDKSLLSFDGVNKSLNDSYQSVVFKGKIVDETAAKKLKEVADIVDDWQKSNPVEFHTPEGMDALKQRVGAVLESIPLESKNARRVVGDVYHSIRGEITKQAPTYAKTMKDYSDAIDEIKEIERTLSLGNKASVDTAMRKLQSITRNNVNTNYGNRGDLVNMLEQRGGRSLEPALAGQALNSFQSRGLGGAVAGGMGLGAYGVGGGDLAAGVLTLQSPRLMGELVHGAGRAARIPTLPIQMLQEYGANPAFFTNLLAQTGGLISQPETDR